MLQQTVINYLNDANNGIKHMSIFWVSDAEVQQKITPSKKKWS